MISSNIVISLGMVGALSIVRFRTAIKEPIDTMFYFWAIIEGLCVGAEQIKLALVTSAFIVAIIFTCSIRFVIRYKYLLVVHGDETLKAEEVAEYLNSMRPKAVLQSLSKSDERTELIYEISMKNPLNDDQTSALMEIKGTVDINCVIENGN